MASSAFLPFGKALRAATGAPADKLVPPARAAAVEAKPRWKRPPSSIVPLKRAGAADRGTAASPAVRDDPFWYARSSWRILSLAAAGDSGGGW